MKQRRFIVAVWIAFVARGSLHALIAPMWNGFDEPFHLAYVTFVAEHGRPPGFVEPAVPEYYFSAMPLLPNGVGALSGGTHAPSFGAWRMMSPAAQAARRAQAEAVTRPTPNERHRYGSPDYERQQPPLFYYVAAPVARLFRDVSLPTLLVVMRLFCVLVASLVVPFAAGLARVVLPPRGVLFALPIVALVPNTLFFVDRVTNDALAWPLMALSCTFLVLCARRPGSVRRFVILGLLAAVGVWTKLTFLPALPAALAAVLLARRRRDGRESGWYPFLGAVVLPLVLVAPLLLWNRVASGAWTGITYAVATSNLGLRAYANILSTFDFGRLLRKWGGGHLWAGGWGFVIPEPATYMMIELALAGLVGLGALAAWWRGGGLPGASRMIPLAAFAAFFVGAMLVHALSCAVGTAERGTPSCGGEGWYLDLLRPIEAVALASLACAALPARATRAATGAVLLLLLAADGAGTAALLLPRWAGYAAGLATVGQPLLPTVAKLMAGSVTAAPISFPPSLAWALVAVVLTSALATFLLAGDRTDRVGLRRAPGSLGAPRSSP